MVAARMADYFSGSIDRNRENVNTEIYLCQFWTFKSLKGLKSVVLRFTMVNFKHFLNPLV